MMMNDSTAMTQTTPCSMMTCTTREYSNLCNYISSLLTAACFIPAHLLCQFALFSTHPLQPPTQQLTPPMHNPFHHQPDLKNTCLTLAQYQPFPGLQTPSMALSWLPIDHALPEHMDHPLDGPHTIYMCSIPLLLHPNRPTTQPYSVDDSSTWHITNPPNNCHHSYPPILCDLPSP